MCFTNMFAVLLVQKYALQPVRGVHPELHIIVLAAGGEFEYGDPGLAAYGFESEFLCEEHVIIQIYQYGKWPTNSGQGLKGVWPLDATARQNGLCGQVIYSWPEWDTHTKPAYLKISKQQLQDFILAGSATARPCKVSNAKERVQTVAIQPVQSQKAKKKKHSHVYMEVSDKENVSNVVTATKRSGKPSAKMVQVIASRRG